jgi:hypothetical protein
MCIRAIIETTIYLLVGQHRHGHRHHQHGRSLPHTFYISLGVDCLWHLIKVVAAVALLGTLAAAVFAGYSAWFSEKQKQATQANAILAKYRDPILLAAFDLQSRLYNIVEHGIRQWIYKEDRKKEYFIHHTLFLFGRYFAWEQIMHHEIQFIQFSQEKQARMLRDVQHSLGETLHCDASPSPGMIWLGYQQALGELMIDVDQHKQRCCIGYAKFQQLYREDKTFQSWFAPLAADLEEIARSEPGTNDQRFQTVQHHLVELVRVLDPKGTC